jgi:heme/copper-type cytochrome/quinol oxidase subunit 2
MTYLRRHSKTLVLALVACVVLPALVSACPLCKDAQPSNAVAGTDMWRGIYWSILLMIAVPFSAVGAVIVAIVRARRRASAVPATSFSAGVPAGAVPAALPFPESGRART